MGCSNRGWRRAAVALAACAWAACAPASFAGTAADRIERGRYLAAAGGCFACHTDRKGGAPAYAGGAALRTPFGTFYAPNITPDRTHGIGAWNEADFVRAMREGIAPDGAHYFPAFPYTSFTGASDADLRALRAYLSCLPPAARPDRPHELRFPFGWRFLLTFWKWLNFRPGPLPADPSMPPVLARGAYLVEALAHCGECHTPRDAIGGLDRSAWMAGTADGPEGVLVPNVTPDRATGIGRWTDGEIADYLATGLDPEGDVAGSLMAEVIEHGASKLTEPDLRAIVAYLKALPPIRNRLRRPRRRPGESPASRSPSARRERWTG